MAVALERKKILIVMTFVVVFLCIVMTFVVVFLCIQVCYVTLVFDRFRGTLKLFSHCSDARFLARDCPYNKEERCVMSRRPIGNFTIYGCCCNSTNCPGGNLTIPSPPSPPTNPTITSVTGTTEVEQPSEGK